MQYMYLWADYPNNNTNSRPHSRLWQKKSNKLPATIFSLFLFYTILFLLVSICVSGCLTRFDALHRVWACTVIYVWSLSKEHNINLGQTSLECLCKDDNAKVYGIKCCNLEWDSWRNSAIVKKKISFISCFFWCFKWFILW